MFRRATRYVCTEMKPRKARPSMCRSAGVRIFFLAGGLAILVLLSRAAADTSSRPSDVVRVCILPFYTSATRASLDSDLAPLLEADLSGIPWLELIPAKSVYEVVYELQPQPWFVEGIWGRDWHRRDAEVYLWMRSRLLQRARARFPSDYYLVGRVISTGMRKTVVIEVTEPDFRQQAVYTSTQRADRVEDIPDAISRAAQEIRDFLGKGISARSIEEVRKQYLARMISLDTAVRKTAEQVKAHPKALALRVLLLSLYEEDKKTYADRARDTAAEIVRSWDPGDEKVVDLAERLGVDPFLVLCREQARARDWSGVEKAARLGREKYPLRAAEYEKWEARARKALQK